MMHSRFAATIGLVAIAVLALTGCAGAPADNGGTGGSADSPGVTATTVSIGTVSDQTGPTTGIQLPWLHGVQAAVKAANDAGGVNGRTIELLSEDDKYDVALGQPAFKKLVSQTPTAAIMGLNTGNVQAAIVPLIDSSGVPVLSGQTTTQDALDAKSKFFFGIAPTYADQVNAILGYAPVRIGKDKLSVVVVNNGTATGVEVVNLVKAASGDKVNLVGDIVVEAAATSVDAQLQTIIGLNPDLIVFHGTSATVNLFARAQEKFGTQYPLIGIAPSGGPSAFTGATPEFGNLYEYVQWASPVPIQEDGTDAMTKAAKAANYGEEVNNPDFVAGYAGGLVVIEAVRLAGDNPTRDGIRKALVGMSDFSTGNVTPDVSFSDTDRVGVQELRPMRWNYDTKALEAIGNFGDYSFAK